MMLPPFVVTKRSEANEGQTSEVIPASFPSSLLSLPLRHPGRPRNTLRRITSQVTKCWPKRKLLIRAPFIPNTAIEKVSNLPRCLLTNLARQLAFLRVGHSLHVLVVQHQPSQNLARDSGNGAQHVLRRLVESLALWVFAVFETLHDGFDGVGLVLLLFELFEDFGCLVGRGGPDDAEAGEGEGEEDKFALQIGVAWACVANGCTEVGERFEGESFLLVEFDEQHGVLVVLEHCFGLVEEAAVLEGAD